MSELNNLIKEGKLERAAEILYKDAFYLFNTYCPDVQITLEEFAKVAPYIIKEFQDPDIPTDAPIDSPYRTLTIKFEGPEGDEEFVAPSDVVKKYYMGYNYSYPCPIIKGYVTETPVVKGKMGDEDTTVTVAYEKEEEPTEKVTLTITYVGPEGDTGFVAPETYVKELGFGEEYMVVSPTVEGYTPDKQDVSGAAEDQDINVTVTYTKNISSVTLTITYEGPEGDTEFPGAEPHVEELEVGDVYNVESPIIEGYTPDQEVVEGIVEGSDPIDIVVTYEKD